VRRRDTDVRPAIVARLTVAIALIAVLAGCAGGGQAGASATARTGVKESMSPASATHLASPSASRSPGERPAPAPKPTPPAPSALPVAPASAAAEPQTTAFPKTTNAAFNAEVHDIWLAVTTGDPDYARPAFFPEKAYEQVKAIADPAADWENRLWYDFTLDLAAVHRLVRPGATLTKVVVPAQYAQWIPEGACYNSIGYWHVPGSRVVYQQDGTTYSFGLASFISWRGDWYLVHLGALSRGGAYGIVDDPQRGEGVPGPPGGC
jgi:hypothetical protein